METLYSIFGFSFVDAITRVLLVALVIFLTWLAQLGVRSLIVRTVKAILRAVRVMGRVDVERELEIELTDRLTAPVRLFVLVIGIRLALVFVSELLRFRTLFDNIAISLLIFAVFWGLYRVVGIVSQTYIRVSRRDTFPLDETIVRFMGQVSVFLILVFAFVLILQQWGQDVGALIAGLGVASLAVALAAQDALSNLIAYFAIIADAPFKVGDMIEFSDIVGRVEAISFRSTRIRTRDNSLLVVPNQTIANANIENWARTYKRRLHMIVGLTYSTTVEQMSKVIQDIDRMLDDNPIVTKDRKVVEFVAYNDSSLDVLVSCMVRVSLLGRYGSGEDECESQVALYHRIEQCLSCVPHTHCLART